MFRIISTKALKAFYSVYPDSEKALITWRKTTKSAEWENPAELRGTWGTADFVKNLTIFDICGNKYRLITYIDYGRRKVYIRAVLTHTEYDTGKWKNDDWCE